jgi:hypothetical protein
MKRLQENSKPEIFMLQGKVALVLIGALIYLGWLLGGVI